MKWNNFRGNDFNNTHISNIEVAFYPLLQEQVLKGEIPQFKTGEEIVLLWTEPDFCWTKEKVALFFDGPPHDKARRGAKDDIQNEYLTDLGWKVIRIHYDGKPVSKAKQATALKWLKEVLEDGGSKKLFEFDLEMEEMD